MISKLVNMLAIVLMVVACVCIPFGFPVFILIGLLHLSELLGVESAK